MLAYNSSKNIKIACRMVSQNDIHSLNMSFSMLSMFSVFFLINKNARLFKSIALNIKKWCCKKNSNICFKLQQILLYMHRSGVKRNFKMKKCTPRQDYLGIIRLYFKAQMLWSSAGTVDCGLGMYKFPIRTKYTCSN